MAHELETLLREACERGITHLTLYPVPSADGKTTYWHARGTPSTMHKHVSAVDTDPIKAITGVLLGLPKAPAQRKKKITATVTEPAPETRDTERDQERDQVDPACGWMLRP